MNAPLRRLPDISRSRIATRPQMCRWNEAEAGVFNVQFLFMKTLAISCLQVWR